MTAPARHEPIIEAPKPSDYTDMVKYQRDYDMWKRSGGLEAAIVNLKGLKASVDELNTMVGIKTNTTTQAQINLKANKADLGTISSQNANSVAITGGSLTGVNISESDITIPSGTSGSNAELGGTLFVDVTSVGNVGAVQTDLMSYSLPANSLSANKDSYEITAWGTFAANANMKTVTLEYGTDVLFNSGGAVINNGSWSLRCFIFRKATSNQTTFTIAMSDNVLFTNETKTVAATQNETSAVTIKVTATGVADNDILQDGMSVKWFKGI